MTFSITSREGIKWNDGPLTEPTNTFVLTYNSHFVDIRSLPDTNVSSSSSSNTNTNTHSSFPFDWAFYGQVLKPKDGHGETTYTHDIDSRYIHAIATGPKSDAEKYLEADSGSSTVLANGDDAEEGYMLNPETLKSEKFLEIWRPLVATRAPQKVAKGGRAQEEGEKAECLVLVVDDDGDGVAGKKYRGKLVKVGSWVQAIVQEVGVDGVQSLTLVRAVKGDGEQTWDKLVAWGNALEVIPVSDAEYEQFNHVGKKCAVGGLVWKTLHC